VYIFHQGKWDRENKKNAVGWDGWGEKCTHKKMSMKEMGVGWVENVQKKTTFSITVWTKIKFNK
jgi:hypothetical protein